MSDQMDVDTPSAIKRSNSAPMINEENNIAQMTTTKTKQPVPNTSQQASRDASRCRRFSISYPLAVAASAPRLTPRISQLRQEEFADVLNTREIAYEREVQSAIQMSQSCEDLTLFGADATNKNVAAFVSNNNRTNFTLSSPTKFAKTCLTWKMSPSPTRKSFTTRRSLSPIAMRPSSLQSIKRKFDLDDDSSNNSTSSTCSLNNKWPPCKKMNVAELRNGFSSLVTSPLSVGTPESTCSSVESPSFMFRPVDSPSSSGVFSGNGDEPMDVKNN